MISPNGLSKPLTDSTLYRLSHAYRIKNRFVVLLYMLLIDIKACDLVTHKLKTSDCNFKTIRT